MILLLVVLEIVCWCRKRRHQGLPHTSDISLQQGLKASCDTTGSSKSTSTPPGKTGRFDSPFRKKFQRNKVEEITETRDLADLPLGQPLDVETGEGRSAAFSSNDAEWDQDTITDAIGHYGWTMVGRGGFGTVFKGNHPAHGDVAVKILDRATISLEQYGAEVENMKSMSSSNPECIVQLKAKSSAAEAKEMVIVTEWMDGGSLHGHLKKNPDWLFRLKVMKGVSECLESIHGQSLPHGNLKPGRHIGLPASFWQSRFWV